MKCGNFVNFSGKYHKHSGYSATFSGKNQVKFGHFDNFSYKFFGQKCRAPLKLTELLRLCFGPLSFVTSNEEVVCNLLFCASVDLHCVLLGDPLSLGFDSGCLSICPSVHGNRTRTSKRSCRSRKRAVHVCSPGVAAARHVRTLQRGRLVLLIL